METAAGSSQTGPKTPNKPEIALSPSLRALLETLPVGTPVERPALNLVARERLGLNPRQIGQRLGWLVARGAVAKVFPNEGRGVPAYERRS